MFGLDVELAQEQVEVLIARGGESEMVAFGFGLPYMIKKEFKLICLMFVFAEGNAQQLRVIGYI